MVLLDLCLFINLIKKYKNFIGNSVNGDTYFLMINVIDYYIIGSFLIYKNI